MRLRKESALRGRKIRLGFNTKVVISARILAGIAERTRGLIGASQNDSAVLLLNCSDIHTHLMTIPIDVAFINSEGEVLSVCLALNRGARIRCFGALAVLERPASTCEWLVPGNQVLSQMLL